MTAQSLNPQISPEDEALLKRLESGEEIVSWSETTGRFKELATGIILQFADSEMAGAAGFAPFINKGSTIEERLNIASMVAQKMKMAKLAYEALSGLNFNSNRYLACHCFDSRVVRDSFLGFSRSSADKRINALLYPLEGLEDMLVFTYLMAVMARIMINEFTSSSFLPLKELATQCLPLETAHAQEALTALKTRIQTTEKRQLLEISLAYWYPRIETSAGPADSLHNEWHRRFHLKCKTNLEIKEQWQDEILGQFKLLEISFEPQLKRG